MFPGQAVPDCGVSVHDFTTHGRPVCVHVALWAHVFGRVSLCVFVTRVGDHIACTWLCVCT